MKIKVLFVVWLNLSFYFNVQANDRDTLLVSDMQEAEQAVFLITIHEAGTQGTGFLIKDSDKIYIATNFHVVMYAISERDVSIENKSWGRLKIKSVAAVSYLDDLVLIEVDDYKGPVFKLADFDSNSSFGHLMGFPGSKFKTTEVLGIHSLREAKVFNTATCGEEDIVGLTEITVSVLEMTMLQGEKADTAQMFGNSGGPLLNQRKEVIGMVVDGHCKELYFLDSRQIKNLIKTINRSLVPM